MSVRSFFKRLRQDPGTVSLRPYRQLVSRIRTRRDALRTLQHTELDAAIAALRNEPATADLLVEGLALASETARRRLGLDPFDEQIMAALAMLDGRIVDMATGEGKTLVGFLTAAVQGIRGHSVHVLSANAYLAERDAAAGSALFEAFGLTSAAVVEQLSDDERREHYRADIVYATVHQVGYDLLRDRQRQMGQPRLIPRFDVAIIDEVDAVLIDDALVPLVIAGDAAAGSEGPLLSEIVRTMEAGEHFEIDAERRNALFTEDGLQLLEAALGVENLYADDNAELLTAAHLALHAEALTQRDVHYLVENGAIRLINDAKGRVADKQRLPDGLHAAIERKERVTVTASAQILDQVLVETVVGNYREVTGMSGSALEAAERIHDDFQLSTAVIPTHLPCIRDDEQDRLFSTLTERDAAAAERVLEAHRSGRPILIGTSSVAESERFAEILSSRGVKASVLNAKNDAAEAEIISRAGIARTVTVSTQMAGRGVDIVLDAAAMNAGGLLVVGLGRYDSARLDRQLRGRSGRQGDPGSSVFFTSLEDTVVQEHLGSLQYPHEGEITSSRIRSQYEHAQRVAEGEFLQLHRTSREYQRHIDRHRGLILEFRDSILTDPAGIAQYLHTALPEHQIDYWTAPIRRKLAGEVALFHLDRAWSEHLNELAEIREGIHLRALGRQNPLDEFQILAVKRFSTLLPDAAAATKESLAKAEGADSIEDLGLRRPSATWTYMVADNPFGSEADRLVHFGQRIVGAVFGTGKR